MKRLSYISSFSRPLSKLEIDAIAAKSAHNNARDGITGVLFCYNNVFYQTLEGDEEAVDRCYERIRRDHRHTSVFCISMEHGITERRYGGWTMQFVNLDESDESLLIPLRSMLSTLVNNHRVLRRYAPSEVLDGIQHGLDPLTWKAANTERVVMFTDIVASTALTEALSADDMSAVLRKFYTVAIAAVTRHQGMVSKLTGDGFLAYFPHSAAGPAVRAASQIQRELHTLRVASRARKEPMSLLYIGIGISAGTVREGNIGSDDKLDYTILGNPVNRAARLESATRKVGARILFDQSVYQLLGATRNDVISIGRYMPRGKSERVEVYTLDDPVLHFDPKKTSIRDLIEEFRHSI